MNIGSGFYNATENGKMYISISLDEAILELHPELKQVRFSLLEIPQEERKDNSPHYRLSVYKPKTKE
jgi:uncharacterized protein (DUF736 family)